MNIRFLETFFWLARLRSFSETARRLKVTQPVVSARMATLQQDLGVELYRGIGKTFELTPIGRKVLEKCEAIVIASSELEDEVRRASEAPAVSRVGVAEIIALSWLPNLLERLTPADGPATAVVRSGLLSELLEALRNDDIDLALVVGPVHDPTLTSDLICEFMIKWVGSPALLGKDLPTDAAELTNLPIIQPPRYSYRHEKTAEYFRWHNLPNLTSPLAGKQIDVGHGLMVCSHLAINGAGVAPLPVAILDTRIADGSLSILPITQEFLPWQIIALRKHSADIATMSPLLDATRAAVADFAASTDHRFFRARS